MRQNRSQTCGIRWESEKAGDDPNRAPDPERSAASLHGLGAEARAIRDEQIVKHQPSVKINKHQSEGPKEDEMERPGFFRELWW